MNQRVEFALRALKTDNFRALCKEFGISSKTGYKWRERFIQNGLGGMTEESRRPKSCPTGLREEIVCEMIRIKQKHPAWGPRKVRAIYARTHADTPSESSFKRVLEKAGYTEKRRLQSNRQTGRLSSGRRAQAPNEIWTVDFKGWWFGANGRCQPLVVRDEFSRCLLEFRNVPDAKTKTVRVRFEGLFEIHGLPGGIRSDNGAPFANSGSVLGLTQLSAWFVVLGIDLERGRPGCPQDNGAHERLHLDISRELEGRAEEDQAVLDEWRQTFNEERPHEALGMRTPAEVYHNSSKKFTGTPEDLSYETMEARKVQQAGHIVWGGQNIFLSGALAGWSVGLEPAPVKGYWNIWFGKLLIGRLEQSTCTFEPTIG